MKHAWHLTPALLLDQSGGTFKTSTKLKSVCFESIFHKVDDKTRFFVMGHHVILAPLKGLSSDELCMDKSGQP